MSPPAISVRTALALIPPDSSGSDSTPWSSRKTPPRPAVRGPFDRVLVDAPCSGIGSARRRPELLWRARREELSQLARLQVAIAVACADLLRPGGRLVYSV